MNITDKVYDAAQASAQATVQLSSNPQSTLQKILQNIYIHTYKRDLRIVLYLLHDYLPIANAINKNYIYLHT